MNLSLVAKIFRWQECAVTPVVSTCLLLVVVHLGYVFSAVGVSPGELPRLIGNSSQVLSSWHGVAHIKETVRVTQVCHAVKVY